MFITLEELTYDFIKAFFIEAMPDDIHNNIFFQELEFKKNGEKS